MSVVAFPSRTLLKEHRRIAAAARRDGFSVDMYLRACLDVTLTKGDRTRRYHLRPGRLKHEWFGQVWFGTLQHRGAILNGVIEAHHHLAQFSRELAELELDGWVRAVATPPPSRARRQP